MIGPVFAHELLVTSHVSALQRGQLHHTRLRTGRQLLGEEPAEPEDSTPKKVKR